MIQPILCHAPIAFHRADRDTENLSGFLLAQIPKEPEFHDPTQAGFFLLKLLKASSNASNWSEGPTATARASPKPSFSHLILIFHLA